MAHYIFNKNRLFQEYHSFFEQFSTDAPLHLKRLRDLAKENAISQPLEQKALLYNFCAEHSKVDLLPSCPFFFEIDTGRSTKTINQWKEPPAGLLNWLLLENQEYIKAFENWKRPYESSGVLYSEMPVDYAHHYADCERVLKFGFLGLKTQISSIEGKTKEEADFLNAAGEACSSICKIAARFADKARSMAKSCLDSEDRDVLIQIAKCAERVPALPADTFYEALCVIVFTREIMQKLEGMNYAVLGHVDRLLYPYYLNDMKNGIITYQQAKEYLACFLALTDARWQADDVDGGANTSIVIGGCDKHGKPIFNDITRMIIEVFDEHRLVNPKLQARLSKDHPVEYIEILASLIGSGCNALTIFNDDVLIAAQCRAGKELVDARLYLAGGCQEPTLPNELNCRAFAYVNLPQILRISLLEKEIAKLNEESGLKLRIITGVKTFEEFYQAYLHNFSELVKKFVSGFNHFEAQWDKINPCPLHSVTIEGCVENRKDITAGGSKYNSNSLSLTGFGTLVDSLYAIKTAIFERNYVDLEELVLAIETNYEKNEVLRQYLLNRIPKYGEENDGLDCFIKSLSEDLAKHTKDLPNSHGGNYESSFFSFYAYMWLKDSTGATPDGRKGGMPLSRGINPSETTRGVNAANLLHAQKSLNLRDYPGCAVLYMDLPVTLQKRDEKVCKAIIQSFLYVDGSTMDFNLLNHEQLIEAQRQPERYRNITVRVCGYSAQFVALKKEIQDEIIARIQRVGGIPEC